MKKKQWSFIAACILVASVFCVAGAESASIEPLPFNPSQYSEEQLIGLNALIADTIQSMTPSYEPFSVPIGKWTIGTNIDAGTYSISPKPGKSLYMHLYSQRWNGDCINIGTETDTFPIQYVELNNGDILNVELNGAIFSQAKDVVRLTEDRDVKTNYDVSNLTRKDLISINAAIVESLKDSKSIGPFTLGSGIWKVGTNIPAGVYDVGIIGTKDCANFSYRSYESEADVSVWGGDSIFGFRNDSESLVARTYDEGNIIVIEGVQAVFTPSKGDVHFGP